MAKQKGASWWKVFYHQRPVIESIPDSDVGAGMKAAFRYFGGEEIAKSELSQAAYIVFCSMKEQIDESKHDYALSVEKGRLGGNKRWGNE